MTPDLPAALLELPRLMVLELGLKDWLLHALLCLCIAMICGFIARLLVALTSGALGLAAKQRERAFRAAWAALTLVACTAWFMVALHSEEELIMVTNEAQLTITMTQRPGNNKALPSCRIRARQIGDGRVVASRRLTGVCPRTKRARLNAIKETISSR